MVSPSKPKHSRVASHQQSNKCKLIKGSKPLVNYRFYLDIENHNVSSKIEHKIKELGGSIEFFLAKEVTHFVTDKPFDYNPQQQSHDLSCPSPQQLSSNSQPKQQSLTPQTPHTNESANTPSPHVGTPNETRATSSKHRSRADAMLQRARTHTCDTSTTNNRGPSLAHSPIQLAKSWGTPVWTPEYTLKFLEKVTNNLVYTSDTKSIAGGHSNNTSHHHHKPKAANAKRLKGDFLKVESFDRNHRPYYQEFKRWPTINLNSFIGTCPFLSGDSDIPNRDRSLCIQPLKEPKKDDDAPATAIATTVAATKINESVDNNTMTRKSRSKHMRNTAKNDLKHSSDKQCGYCEICHIEYDVLSVHLQSTEHTNFVKNNDNFLALDTLISNSASVQSFLTVNKPQPKIDIDSGIFGKRTGKRVGKLYRPEDIEIKQTADLKITAEYIKLNGTNFTPPPMMTRNSRRTEMMLIDSPTKPDSTKVKAQRSPVKSEQANEDDDDEDEEDEDEPLTKMRARRESAKRINYAEPKEDEENSNDSKVKLQKIRLRGIRWRAPSHEDHPSVTQPIVYKVVEESSNSKSMISAVERTSAGNNRKEPLVEQNKPSGGIKVRICRVRESELSLLTNEADNFMFPRVNSELATDEDRHSTSEREDASVEIVSSELEQITQRTRKQSDASSVDANSKRKRRRNHLEAFLTDQTEYYKFDKPDSRLRFQEAPFQPFLTRFDHDMTSSGRGSTTIPSATATRSMMMHCTSPTSKLNDSLRDTEDRKGAIPYDVSKMLTNSTVKMHKFAFERIPSTEPWFETFQRQDDCREQIFEYWGSTAYRKLPFELGPLPPHPPDCCHLSKLRSSKTNRQNSQPKNRNKKLKITKNPTRTITSIIEEHPQQEVTAEQEAADEMKRLLDEQLLQKRLVKIQRQLEVQKPGSMTPTCDVRSFSFPLQQPASKKSPVYFTASVDATRPAVLTLKSEPLEKKMHKRNIMRDFEPSSSVSGSSSNMGKSVPTEEAKRNSFLFDINGQPRKSPREHASTLAILSCLVQQRRKREKELNGGISPDKLMSTVKNDQITDDESDEYEDAMTELSNTDIVEQSMKEDIEPDIKHECDSIQECVVEQSPPPLPPPTQPPPKSVTLSENIVCHDERSNSSLNLRHLLANDKQKSADKTDSKVFPRMPIINYVNPHHLCREIDKELTKTFSPVAEDSFSMDNLDASPNDNCDDLTLLQTPKDFFEIITTVEPGPLRYRSYVNLKKPTGMSSFSNRYRKRKNNRTGWPTSPKRKLLIKKENDNESMCSVSNTEIDEDLDGTGAGGGVDCVPSSSVAVFPLSAAASSSKSPPSDHRLIDLSSRLGQPDEDEMDDCFYVQRSKLNSLGEDCHSKDDDSLCNDDRNSIIFLTSSSEKAENSDIFTVSSDSVDTMDMTGAAAAAAAARVGAVTPTTTYNNVVKSVAIDNDVLSVKSASLVQCSDESSADITLAELLKKQIGVTTSGGNVANNVRRHNIRLVKGKTKKQKNNKYLKRRKSVMIVRKVSNSAVQKSGGGTSTTTTSEWTTVTSNIRKVKLLQPIIRVKKINEHDFNGSNSSRVGSTGVLPPNNLNNRHHSNHQVNNRHAAAAAHQSTDVDRKSIRNSPQKVQFSPPKLRKPRGRWYRER